jgi:hypothetical protein
MTITPYILNGIQLIILDGISNHVINLWKVTSSEFYPYFQIDTN